MLEFKTEYEKCKNNPYKYITEEWAENVLIHTGKKIFSVISLMPGSLILPEIPFGSKNIVPNINTFLVGPAGLGKSTIADKFESITYFPLKRRDISASDLKMRAISMGMFSLIIEDFTQFCSDYDKVKVAEGILGEEHSIDSSNRREESGEIDRAIGLIEGTLTDLEKYVQQLEGGLLSRCVFLLISISAKEHSSIGDAIARNTGDKEHSNDLKLKENVVIEYYQELKKIQEGNHEKLFPIVEYRIESKFKEESVKKWKNISERLIKDLGEKSYIRDLNYYYKFLVSSAFLNVFNRKTEEIELGRDENGKIRKGLILTPNEEDHRLALKLMLDNMRGKWALDKALFYKRNIKTLEKLKELLYSENGFSDVKNILINISPIAKAIDKMRKDEK